MKKSTQPAAVTFTVNVAGPVVEQVAELPPVTWYVKLNSAVPSYRRGSPEEPPKQALIRRESQAPTS
jgi:hypothetical protein